MKFFAIWSQLGWFACVYAGKFDVGAAVLIVPVITWFLLAKLYLLTRSDSVKLLTLVAIGVLFESVALLLGWITLIHGPKYIPLWFISLWLHFVPSLFLFKPWLGARPFIAALVGAIFGPLSYIAGEELGVLTFSSQMVKIYYLVFWAAFIPLSLLALNQPSLNRSR